MDTYTATRLQLSDSLDSFPECLVFGNVNEIRVCSGLGTSLRLDMYMWRSRSSLLASLQ